MTAHISRAYAVLAPGVAWVCDDGTYEGTTWPEGYEAPTAEQVAETLLDIAREARCDDVDALYAEKLLAGFTYEAARFELNDFSQSKIGDLASSAALYLLGVAGVTWEPTVFVSADNVPVLFETAESFMPFANSAKIVAKAMFARRFVLKQTCRAAPDAAGLAAIDITVGWPE